ncbi:MAG: hypothetical protein PCFJNLEI_02029 [Verrucomicrobiae bacterium]|nr:hypothetical protein [Verrucomicrobiae bacterium]
MNSHRVIYCTLALTIAISLLPATVLWAKEPLGRAKLLLPEQVLAGFAKPGDRVAVIVNLVTPARAKQPTDWNARASLQSLQVAIRATTDQVLGAVDGKEHRVRLRFDNQASFSCDVTERGLQQLLNHPLVESVEPVQELEAHLAQGIPLMNAFATRSMYSGTNIAIAICDTGIDYTHARLGGGGFPNGKVIGGYDFGDWDADPKPNDQAHGTACAGIAAGDLDAIGDYIGGVAPEAKLYALKISYGSTKTASNDSMVAAWDWCVTHKNDDPSNPILVMSTSFGSGRYYTPGSCDSYSPAMTTAASNAVAAGITVLASSGNDGYCDSVSWPAGISSVISVGAVYDQGIGTYDFCVSSSSCANKSLICGGSPPQLRQWARDTTASDRVAVYANVSTNLSLLAPAEHCYTLDIVGANGSSTNDYYAFFGGTSAACPYAAGAVACLQQAARTLLGDYLSPATVRALLTESGELLTDHKVTMVKPRVDLGNAIASLGEYNSWTNVADGRWQDVGNWSLGVAPTSTHARVQIANTNGNTVTINSDTVTSHPDTMIVKCLMLSAPAGTHNTLVLSNAGPSVPLQVLNACTLSSGGAMYLTDSVLRVEGLTGVGLTVNGSLALQNNALLLATNCSVRIGNPTSGSLIISGGTLASRDVTVGRVFGAHGLLSMAGGTITVASVLTVGAMSGATGDVWIADGQLVVTNAATYIGSNGIGQLTVSNGNMRANSLYAGFNPGSRGTLTFAGGSNLLTASLYAGRFGSSTGVVWVTGGVTTITNSTSFIGYNGVGQLTISNGTVQMSQVYVGSFSGSLGTLTVAGGSYLLKSSLYAGQSSLSKGAVWVTGGEVDISKNYIYVGYFGLGELNVSNGALRSAGMVLGSSAGAIGMATFAGGTNIIDTLTIASSAGATGTVWVTDNAVMIVSNLVIGRLACDSGAAAIVSGGKLYVTNATGNATLELRGGSLIVTGGLLRADRLLATNSCANLLIAGGTVEFGSYQLNPNRDADGDGLPNGWEQDRGLNPLDATGINGGNGDLDGDGLPNAWELAHGLNPAVGTGNDGPSGDPDGDGQTNGSELLTGMNPTNAASYFHVLSVFPEGPDLRVFWLTAGSRTNQVQAAPIIGTPFTNIGPLIIIPGSGEITTNYLDTGAGTNQPSRFYQIRLVP